MYVWSDVLGNKKDLIRGDLDRALSSTYGKPWAGEVTCHAII